MNRGWSRNLAHVRWIVPLTLGLCLAIRPGSAGLAGRSAGKDALWDPLCGGQLHIELSPDPPISDEPIRLKCSGDWRDSCVPSYLTSAIGPGRVELHAVLDYPASVGCADVITPWSLETAVGPLPGASYLLELYMRDLRTPSVATLCASRRFTVLGGLSQIFLPLLGRPPDLAMVGEGDSLNGGASDDFGMPRCTRSPAQISPDW